MKTAFGRLLPYPFVSVALAAAWLMLQQSLSPGHILLGLAIGFGGGRILQRLDMPPGMTRRPRAASQLIGLVVADIVRSNLTVARLILSRQLDRGHADFITLDLATRNPYALTCLALMITAAPGTLWVKYDSHTGVLTIHMIDTLGKDVWITNIKDIYEPLLREIFE